MLYGEKMQNKFIDSKSLLLFFIFTFILGIFADGYVFVSYVPAHDGMMTITHDQSWQTSIGRGLMQVYVKFRGVVDGPCLIGMLTLVYTAIAAYLLNEILEVSDEIWKIFAIS